MLLNDYDRELLKDMTQCVVVLASAASMTTSPLPPVGTVLVPVSARELRRAQAVFRKLHEIASEELRNGG